MININPNKKQDSVNKLLEAQLANIQTQFDQLNDAITALTSSVTSNFTTVNSNIASCQSLIADMTTTQQTTAESLTALQTSLAALQTSLAESLATVNVTATTVNSTTENTTTLNAVNATITGLISGIEATITKITATNLTAENATIENLTTTTLNLSEINAEQATVTNAVNTYTKTTELTAEGIKSQQSYNSVGYNTNDKVEKFKFVLNAGFIAYSTDTDDTWSITWNGALEYSNPKLTIKRIDVKFEDDENVAYVYFNHPGTDLDFNVINFGDFDVTLSSEVIDKSGAYEEENCEYFGIIADVNGGSSSGLTPMFVSVLPETGLSSYLYIVSGDRSYVWDSTNSVFKELSGDLNAEIANRTAADTELSGLIATNATNIAANTASIQAHTTEIANVKTSVATNAANIATNTTNISTNASDIATNAESINTINNTIATTKNRLTTDETNIATNTSDIATVKSTYQKKLTAGSNIAISDDNEISCDVSTMNFKGSVDTYDDLPTTADIGDVWNVIDIASNYCWNGSAWLSIGSSVDVSGFMTKENPTGTGAFSMNRLANSGVGNYSTAEGYNCAASGNSAHAEGNQAQARGDYSHAEGKSTYAVGESAHAEGNQTHANGYYAHAEGADCEVSIGIYSAHAEGSHTVASSNYQHVQGKYNVEDTARTYADIVGNGSKDSDRSNASALDWDGNLYLKGDIYTGCNADSTGGTSLNDTLTQYAHYDVGAVCSTAIDTAGKTIVIDKFALVAGAVIKVLFMYGNSADTPTITITDSNGTVISEGVEVKTVRGGEKVTPTNHTGYWRGATESSSEMWQPYTTLELMYDGTDWVIFGNPTVESYIASDSKSGYIVQADGFTRQWAFRSADSVITETINFRVVLTGIPFIMCRSVMESSSSPTICSFGYRVSATGFTTTKTDSYAFTWEAVGY